MQSHHEISNDSVAVLLLGGEQLRKYEEESSDDAFKIFEIRNLDVVYFGDNRGK